MSDGSRYPLVQLRYVATTGTGHTPSRSRPEYWLEAERTIPWITLADVGTLRDGTVTVIHETVERVSEAGVANSSAVVHPAGTVLLSRTASVGYSAVMGRAMAVSQDFMTWTPGPRLAARFLLYVLRGMRPSLLGLMHGSTHKTIYMPDLLALRTPLPNVTRQAAIVDFLDRETSRVAELSARLPRLRALAEEAALARVESSLVDGRLTSLRHLGIGVEQGWSPEADDRAPDDGEVGVLRLTAISSETFRPSEAKALRQATSAQIARFRVGQGDLLMVRASGSLSLLGRCALVAHDPPAPLLFSDLMYRLSGGSIPTDVLALLLRSSRGRAELEGLKRGAANSKLRLQDVRALRVPLPPSSHHRSLAVHVRESVPLGTCFERAASRLRGLLQEYRDALITEAVTGQLDVNTVSDAQMDERLHQAVEAPAA